MTDNPPPQPDTAPSPLSTGEVGTLQSRVHPWLMACFGEEIAADKIERNHRFLEEALELVQACGCTQSEAHQLVDYVYGRPDGDINQEIGGVMITLAALCLANGFDMHVAGETELVRIWGKVDSIRAKQAAKPRHSPLPALSHPPATEQIRREVIEKIIKKMIRSGELSEYRTYDDCGLEVGEYVDLICKVSALALLQTESKA